MIRQPAPKPDVIARRDAIVAGLRALLPESGLIAEPLRLKPYETDGLSAYRQPPLAVALPETTEQTAAVLRFCHQNGVRVIPRGAGTSLSGGALPLADAVVVGMMRMNQILDINYPDRLRRGAGRGHQYRHHQRRLRPTASSTRPTHPVAARLHDRRQRQHELRRRPLPEIRGHRQQPARA